MPLKWRTRVVFLMIIFLLKRDLSSGQLKSKDSALESFLSIHGDLTLYFKKVSLPSQGQLQYRFNAISPYLTSGFKGKWYLLYDQEERPSSEEGIDKIFISIYRPGGKDKLVMGNYTAGFGQGMVLNVHPHSPPGIESDLTNYPSWKGWGYQIDSDKIFLSLFQAGSQFIASSLWGTALTWEIKPGQQIGFVGCFMEALPLIWGLNFTKEWDFLSLAGEISGGDNRGLFLRTKINFQKIEGTVVYCSQEFDNPVGYIERKPGIYIAGREGETFWLHFYIPVNESFSLESSFVKDDVFEPPGTTFSRQLGGKWVPRKGLKISAVYSSKEKENIPQETLMGEIEREFFPFALSLAGQISSPYDRFWKGKLEYISTNFQLEYHLKYGDAFREQQINLYPGKGDNLWEIEYFCREGENGFQQKFSTQIKWKW